MNVDLTPVWQFLDPTISAVGAVLVGIIFKEIISVLKIQQGSKAADDLDQALSHGENMAIAWLHSKENTEKTITVPDGVMATIASAVIQLAPAAEKSLGITPDNVAQLVQARIGASIVWSPQMHPNPANTGETAAVPPTKTA